MAYQFTQTGAELQDLIDRIYQIAEEYDPGTSYVIGDYCSSGGKVYRCTAATTGTFEPSKWTDSVIVMDAVKSLKGRMDTAEGDIDALETTVGDMGGLKFQTSTLAKNASKTINYYMFAIVYAYRSSYTGSPEVALCDFWGGVTNAHSQTAYPVTTGGSEGARTATLTNNSTSYCQYIFFYK